MAFILHPRPRPILRRQYLRPPPQTPPRPPAPPRRPAARRRMTVDARGARVRVRGRLIYRAVVARPCVVVVPVARPRTYGSAEKREWTIIDFRAVRSSPSVRHVARTRVGPRGRRSKTRKPRDDVNGTPTSFIAPDGLYGFFFFFYFFRVEFGKFFPTCSKSRGPREPRDRLWPFHRLLVPKSQTVPENVLWYVSMGSDVQLEFSINFGTTINGKRKKKKKHIACECVIRI